MVVHSRNPSPGKSRLYSSSVITISASRLQSRIEALARFGALPGAGVTRPCWSPQHEEARAWLAGELSAAGLETWVDRAGNVFGALGLRAFGADAPAVLTGSHIDTVPEGGILDGALGVLAGLEALETIRETNAPHRRPLAVAAWSDEERSEEHTSELQSPCNLVCRLLLEKKKSVRTT